MPSKIAQTFSIKIAHFENVYISCYCVGIFPAVVVTLPRQKKTGERECSKCVFNNMFI